MAKHLVMIHGMWGGGWYWEPFKTFFEAEGYLCHTPDLRYHGDGAGADPALGDLSLLDYVDDLQDFIESLPEKPVVIGHSMGGLIAQKLAERDLVETLVLACPAPPADIFAISCSALRSFSPLMLKPGFWKNPHRPDFQSVAKSSFQLIPPHLQRQYYDRLCYESGRVVLEIALPLLDKRKATAVKASKVRCPVLVLSAELDQLTPVKVVHKIANKYPQSDYHTFSGHTHWVIAEPGWEDCAHYIHQWLQRQANHRPEATGGISPVFSCGL